jgi:hypothetical protein
VCEVLEEAIAGGENDVKLTGLTTISTTDLTVAKSAIRDKFSAAQPPLRLGTDFTLSQVPPNTSNLWVVHSDEATYLLLKKGTDATAEFFARVLPNTKASAEELAAAPQYVNDKAYDKLKGAKYPMSLPFDRDGEEVRAAMRKAGLQRWKLMRTLRGGSPPNNTDGDVAAEYFNISAAGEKALILTPDKTTAGQQERWGEKNEAAWLASVSIVKTFLQKTGLEYVDLLALLDLKFINQAGTLVIQHQDPPKDPPSDLSKKTIAGLTEDKLDLINRFLRLWRKLEGWQMWELDLAIDLLGKQGALDEQLLIDLFYFCELRNRWGGQATVEQTLALFGTLNTKTHFTAPNAKRGDGLYQSLFQNRRVVPTLDSAFEVAKVDVQTSAEKISAHRPAVLAALGLREADLILLAGLTKASDGTAYITDELTLANLSFLSRHVWVSKSLKLRPEDWKLVLKILHQDVPAFGSPKAALEYLEQVDHLRATGFTPDELNWLLAADRAANAAVKEDDAAKFLFGLRQELQAVHKEFDVSNYDFLQAATPTDEAQLSALLTTLLQKLNRDEAAVNSFLATLQGSLVSVVNVQGLPAGFTFPSTITDKPNFIPIRYSESSKTLRFTGLMTAGQQTTLLTDTSLASVKDVAAYQAAIKELFQLPRLVVKFYDPTSPDPQIWLTDDDLLGAANDTLAKRLANAARKALNYLSTTFAENTVVQQCSDRLELTEALTRYLLTRFSLPPETLLKHLTGDFSKTTGVVDYATLKPTFDRLFWATRVATIWKLWKITLKDLDPIIALTAKAQLLDFLTLPLDGTQAIASAERFVRTSRLLAVRESLPETGITLLAVLGKLDKGAYAGFGADVNFLNDAWHDTDVTELVASLDVANPEGYLLAENWERLGDAFDLLGKLNAGAATVKRFAAAVMTGLEARTLTELLCARFGTATWLTLSGEIQNVLRERKRDALTAYLLTLPQPAGAPSGKWENPNDLYAFYLLDVEMGACMQTSRLVQASGSIQLFVQRCFMGLEPDVVVDAHGDDGDSAWLWWVDWMSRYRVWEANRKVFVWPENYFQPGLRKDKSPFFRDLENELMQNEINQDTVEKAFVSYLEKLDGVAQLEVAGFCQEDDGGESILHVFGRTSETEPRSYYYRRCDYLQWTPWEKVELDINSDYLVPAVMNGRLFLCWPVFTEVPDEAGNSQAVFPKDSQPLPKTKKVIQMKLAVSEYRQGKWTPRRVSKDAFPSTQYSGEITKDHYQIWAVDEIDPHGRFTVQFNGFGGLDAQPQPKPVAVLQDAFAISGSKGVPEREIHPNVTLGNFEAALRPKAGSVENDPEFLKWQELAGRSGTDLSLELVSTEPSKVVTPVTVLGVTPPGIFKVVPPWCLSYFDKLLLNGLQLAQRAGGDPAAPTRTGTWLPFACNDKKRTFFVFPTLKDLRRYYPDLMKVNRRQEDELATTVQKEIDKGDRSTWPPDSQLAQEFPEEPPPPYTDEKLKSLVKLHKMKNGRFDLGRARSVDFKEAKFHFKSFYHPFVPDFSRLIQGQGIPALMKRSTQLMKSDFLFEKTYQPSASVWKTDDPAKSGSELYPREIVDFSPDGAYSSYDWELFVFAPWLIASSLRRDQRFAEAREWLEYIFDPVGVEPPPAEPGVPQSDSPMRKFWISEPFFETTTQQYVAQRIENLLQMLAGGTSAPELAQQVLDWRRHAFEPDRIANYRTVAYQKAVVMEYLEILIEWGDNLFQQDSMESLNEATQLYILAAEILGPRPMRVPPRSKPPLESFNELEPKLDAFSNAMVQMENLVSAPQGHDLVGADAAPLPALYFCIPQNDKLLTYWDTVADRLYKIRHCMNLEGAVRQLALFEPPIPPDVLVKAVAAGVDVGAALSDLNAPLPLYRFNVLLQKANEVCNDVKALGGALLAALEKKDAEGLGLLRQSQEIRLLDAVKAVREQQIEEAKENLAAVQGSRKLAEAKTQYYESREFMNAGEAVAMSLNTASTVIDAAIAVGYTASGGLKLFPNFIVGSAGFGGTPHAVAETGGQSFGNSAEDLVKTLESIARGLDKVASLASTMASYQRRQQEWDFQADLARRETSQIDRQIAAAELRIALAEKERDNQALQIENAKTTDAFLRSKYTSQELYQWQVGQISGVYFQCYKLAYDLAKRAERCFRFELGLQDSSYIPFGYWDSLKKGLLSGEKLQYDLRRLETAYLEKNRREFELTKHVSLALLDPLALVKLRETGRCFFHLPEESFDLDYPGHFFRRIKSISLTLPCVASSYTTISCTLRLLKNSLRINTAKGEDGYPRNTDDRGLPADDPRFVETNVPAQAMAASNAQNDSGVFELSFRDERYLPFEGAGAISEWSLELFSDPSSNDFGKPLRQFDYGTLSDAILHVKYTAREDAGPFKNDAVAHLRDYLKQAGATHSLRSFNLRQEFPSKWSQFLNPTSPATENVFELAMEPRLFPLLDQGNTLKITTIWLLARCTNEGSYTVVLEPPLPVPPPPPPPPAQPPADPNAMTLAPAQQYGGLHFSQKDGLDITVAPSGSPVPWKLKMASTGGGSQPLGVEDLFLVLGYSWA